VQSDASDGSDVQRVQPATVAPTTKANSMTEQEGEQRDPKRSAESERCTQDMVPFFAGKSRHLGLPCIRILFRVASPSATDWNILQENQQAGNSFSISVRLIDR